jgi:mono/diheme cytochrome c family protein
MTRSVALFPALVLGLSLGAAALAGQESFDADAAKKLFESKCAPCHPLDRTLRKTKDRPGWQKTVERMKGYAAGAIADAEAQTIVEYLSRARGPANP